MAYPATVVVNGNLGLLTSRQTLAASGKYFVCTNPTPGTAVAYAQVTSFSATANGLFVVSNTNSIGGASIYWDRLTLIQTATVATGTNLRFEVYNETGIVAGTTAVATRTPVNINSAYSSATGATFQSFATGAITIPAAVGSRRLVGIGGLPIGVNVVQDSYVIDFSADGPSAGIAGLTAARATDPARLTTQMNAVVIPPQTTSWINMWGPGSATPSYEWEFCYYEL